MSSLAQPIEAWLVQSDGGEILGTLVVAAAASYLRHRVLGYVSIVLGVVSTILTLVVVHDFSGNGISAAATSPAARWSG